MKISFRNVSGLRLKTAVCALTFILGLFFIVFSIVVTAMPLEYQNVNGKHHSYREDRTARTTKRYLTIEIPDHGISEYEIHPIVVSAFDKKSFLQDVAVGDPTELILQEDNIVAIRINEKSYLDLEDSLKKQKDNHALGYCLGAGFIVISVFAFSTLVTVRRGGRSKNRKR